MRSKAFSSPTLTIYNAEASSENKTHGQNSPINAESLSLVPAVEELRHRERQYNLMEIEQAFTIHSSVFHF